MLKAVKDYYGHSESRLLSVIGVKGLIIVETHDQDIKHIVTRRQEEGRTESERHRKAFRLWGNNYVYLDKGERFQVKRIMVKPGQCTSMQKPFQRAEHWIVVSGIAEVTCGDNIFLLKENESTFIPLGAQHRLKNPGKTDLERIEDNLAPIWEKMILSVSTMNTVEINVF